MNKDLEIIKKKYGENMAHLCRTLFPTILLEPGKLPEVLQDNFPASKNLYSDIKEGNYDNGFQSLIYNKAKIKVNIAESDNTPFNLLKKVGYTLYECNNKGEVDRFKKYYADNEKLCSFNYDDIVERRHMFFAIKDNANELRREDFTNPNLNDEYSKSVLYISFNKGRLNAPKITSRYNTTVNDCDAMYSNNLENIIPGLTSSFEKEYKLNVYNSNGLFNLPNYILAKDNRYYRYNGYYKEHNEQEKNHVSPKNIYYCENNVILYGDEIIRDFCMPERYIFLENYILDISHDKDKDDKKRVFKYKDDSPDGFIDNLQDISKVDIYRDKKNKNKKIIITKENNDIVEITLNQNNNIIKYKNENLENAGENFLSQCEYLEEFDCPKLKKAGKNLLRLNKKLKKFIQPELEEVPDECLAFNEILEVIDVDKAKKIGDDFANSCRELLIFKADNATEIGNDVLQWARKIQVANIKSSEKIGNKFLNMAKDVKINGSSETLKLNAKYIGDGVLSNHECFKKIILDESESIGNSFLSNDEKIEYISAKKNKVIGSFFCSNAKNVQQVELNETEIIEDEFLSNAKKIGKININNVRIIGDRFLKNNEKLDALNIDNLKSYGYEFIPNNRKVKIHASNLSLKDKVYTTHIRKIKKTFEVIKKLNIYNKYSLNNNQELIRGSYNGSMNTRNDSLDNMFNDTTEKNNNKRR